MLILTGDHGLQLTQPIKQSEADHAAACTQQLVRRTVESLLASPEAHDWKRQPSVLYSNGLMLEASAFLHERFGLELRPPLESFNWLEAVLGGLRKDTVARVLSYDFTPQVVRWHLSRMPADIDAVELELELRRVAGSVRVKPDSNIIETDAAATLDMLTSYYGSTPLLKAEPV